MPKLPRRAFVLALGLAFGVLGAVPQGFVRADDVTATAEGFEVTTPPAAFESVRDAVAARGIAIAHAELARLASVTVPLGESEARDVLRVVELLEDLDDVQRVYANFELSDEVLAKLSR